MKNRIKFLAVATAIVSFALINESLEIIQVTKASNVHCNSVGEMEYSDQGYSLMLGKVELASVVVTKNMKSDNK